MPIASPAAHTAASQLNLDLLWGYLSNAAMVIGKALLVFVVCRIVNNLVMKTIDRLFEKLRLDQGIEGFIHSGARIVLWIFTLLIVASTLGFDVSSLVALVSVVSLALSLSVQDLLTNVFAGMTILATQPFKVGQFVEIAGVSGTVTQIAIMRTTLETPDHKEILIPNSEITASKVINFSSEPTRRVDLYFSAGYDAPTALVKEALMEAILADDRILSDPAPFVGIDSYTENGTRYVTKSWCAGPDYWDVYYALNEHVRDSFEAHGISFSYPHVIVHKEE